MDKIYIKVDKKTGMIYLENTVIGRDKENLQQELIFSFENGFVLGSPRLEYKIGNNRYHIPMERIDETYVVPIKNILTVEGKIEMQLVITQVAQDEEIPVFKSNVFYMYCDKSINAQEEPPDDYQYWLDVIEEKITEMDEALIEVDNLDIDASKVGNTATVSITNKEGITKSVEIYDGQTGAVGPQGPKGDKGDKGDTGSQGQQGIAGKDAKINGVNTISIEAGTNITLDQEEGTLTINSTTSDEYVKKTDYATNSVGGVVKVSVGDYGLAMDDGVLKGAVKNVSQYNSMSSKGVVAKGTLENVLTNKAYLVASDIVGKQDITDNTLTTTNKTIPTAINEVNSIAKGANQAVGYSNYSAMVTAINAMDDDEYNVGQNLYVVTVEVPDLWVSSVESTSSTYTYVDDATIISALETNGYIQVGYYKLSMLETQKVDLTNYVTNTDYGTSATAGVVKPANGLSIYSNGNAAALNRTYAQYGEDGNNYFIGKGTLENVITGKGLVSNTDYATSSVGGVVKANTSYGFNMSNGYLTGNTKTYAQYGDANTGMVVSKGTLENVITGKGLVSNTDYATSSVGGVILPYSNFGTSVNSSTGRMSAQTKTYAQYNSLTDALFIGKGTLENVLAGKGLNNIVTLSQSDYDALATKDANTYYYIVEE